MYLIIPCYPNQSYHINKLRIFNYTKIHPKYEQRFYY